MEFKSVSYDNANTEETSVCIGHIRDLSREGWEIKGVTSYQHRTHWFTRVFLQREKKA